MEHRVAFFGDSICVGQHVSVHKIWVSQISARLHHEVDAAINARGDQLIVLNPSINGNTTRMALERMPPDVQQWAVGAIFIQFGLNDCNYWQTDFSVPRVSPDAFTSNLKEMIGRARASGAKFVALGTNHPSNKQGPAHSKIDVHYEDSRKAYNNCIREVARADDAVVLIDTASYLEDLIEKGTLRTSDFLHPDGIHLSVKGHDLYADYMGRHLLPRLAEFLVK